MNTFSNTTMETTITNPVTNPTVPAQETSVPEARTRRSLPMLLLTALVFLLPLVFIPGSSLAGVTSKSFILAAGVLLAGIFLLVRIFRGEQVELRFHPIIFVAVALPIVYALAAFFSPSLRLALFGTGVEVDTVFAVLTLMLAFITTVWASRSKGDVMYMLVALLSAAGLLFLFHLLRLFFGPGFLSFGVFTSPTSTPVGTWNNLGIFFALITLLSAISIDSLRPRGRFALFLWASFVLSLVTLLFVNFMIGWIILGSIASLLVFHALTSRFFNWRTFRRQAMRQSIRVPIATVLLLVVSLLLFLDAYSPTLLNRQPIIGTALVSNLHLTQLEARPSWATTASIVGTVLSKSPILGSGPNTFDHDWLMYKPTVINQTIFWNTSFSSGIGYIPTALISTGVLGALAWLAFLVLFLLLGIRAYRANVSDPMMRALLSITFFLSASLWMFAVFYSPNLTTLAFAAILSGIFVSLLYQTGVLSARSTKLSEHPRLGFVASLASLVILVLVFIGTFGNARALFAASEYDRSIAAFNNGDFDTAAKNIGSAISLSSSDQYEQLAAQVEINRIGAMLSANPNPATEERDQLATLAQQAIQHGVAATTFDKNNYYNWITLGQVYEALARLQTTGASDNATSAYDKAEALNPTSPAIPLARARLAAIGGDTKDAQQFIGEALKRKGDYTAAILLLSQIQIANGDTTNAINSLLAATKTSPTNPVIFFQLGFLEYSIKNYQNAALALEQAVSLASDYSNARYFLGLSYAKLGRTNDAVEQFKRIAAVNPDNTEVQQILANLEAGKDPLSGEPPPPPEKRSTPPIKE